MTTADWVPDGYAFDSIEKIPGDYATAWTPDGATIVTDGPYVGYTQTGPGLTWESPIYPVTASPSA